MDLLESINAGVVNRGRKVKAGRLKEGWREAKCIMVGVRSSRWSAAGGRCSLWLPGVMAGQRGHD